MLLLFRVNRHRDNIQYCRTHLFIVISSDASFSYRFLLSELLEVNICYCVYLFVW